jgi:hypothetical protein
MFHLKVHIAVDRILMFKDPELTELIGELQYVSTIEEETDGETQTMKVFNGTVESELILALILGSFGSTEMQCTKVFSKTLMLKPKGADDYANNAVVVNWNKPQTPDAQKLPEPTLCLMDFPKSVREPLGLPATVIMKRFEIPESVDTEDAIKHGLDPKSNGYFIKQLQHLWPANEETIAVLEEEKIRISLYEQRFLKQIVPITK